MSKYLNCLILFSFLILLFLSIFVSGAETTIQTKNLKSGGNSKSIFHQKVLAMNPAMKNNPMENFNYKFLTLTRLEAVFYEAKIPKLPTEEDPDCSKNYLFTQLYYQIQLPCVNHSMVCTYGELKKEYSSIYPEIEYDLPKHIQTTFGEQRAEKHCIIITYGSFSKVSENIFICHLDLKILAEVQFKISEQVREVYHKNTELFMDYIPNLDVRGRVSGLLRLDQDSLKFINLENKKVIMEVPYLKIQPFAYPFNNREPFTTKSPPDDHYQERCIKVTLKNQSKDIRVFCVFYSAGDFTKKKQLNNYQARWLAEFYSHKINRKMLPTLLQNSLEEMAAKKDSLEVESQLLIPVVFTFREVFNAKSHEIMVKLKLEGKVNQYNMSKVLVKLKVEKIKEVCNEIVLCMRAINYKISKGLLPLGNKDVKYAMDSLNPFVSLYPNRNMRVDSVQDGLGTTLVQEVSRLKGTKNYFAEELDLPAGGVPDYKQIVKAVNFFKEQRENGVKIKKFKDFRKCNSDTQGEGYQLNRKMGLLPYMLEKDFLFNFLGTVGKTIDNNY